MHKVVILYLLASILCSGCHAVKPTAESSTQTDQSATGGQVTGTPVMTFDNALYDFGTVIRGEQREYTFGFTNTGDGELLIELVSSCTCTKTDWPRLAIPPGGKGEIPVVFDSSEKEGEVLIDIDIIANTDPILVSVQFKANVIYGDK
jgi:hypothetical protein